MSGSSLYAYLSHYFFILILSVLVIRPYKIKFIPALFIMLIGTNLLIFLTYVPLNFLYELISPPKKTKAADLTPIGQEKQETAEDVKAAEDAAVAMAAAQKAKAEGAEGEAVDLEADANRSAKSGLSIKSESEEKFE